MLVFLKIDYDLLLILVIPIYNITRKQHLIYIYSFNPIKFKKQYGRSGISEINREIYSV